MFRINSTYTCICTWIYIYKEREVDKVVILPNFISLSSVTSLIIVLYYNYIYLFIQNVTRKLKAPPSLYSL